MFVMTEGMAIQIENSRRIRESLEPLKVPCGAVDPITGSVCVKTKIPDGLKVAGQHISHTHESDDKAEDGFVFKWCGNGSMKPTHQPQFIRDGPSDPHVVHSEEARHG